jgi:hypothetical protein
VVAAKVKSGCDFRLVTNDIEGGFVSGHDFSRAGKLPVFVPSRLQPAADDQQTGIAFPGGVNMTTSEHNSATDDKRELLRHALATLAYRGGKALRGAPADFAEFRVAETSRTPGQILAHIGDLMDWALSMVQSNQRWNDSTPLPWHEEEHRFFAAVQALEDYLASAQPLGVSPEMLLQGPIADAFAHVGQIAMLRRIAGSPVKAENYAKAEIVAGRVGAEQTPPKREF